MRIAVVDPPSYTPPYDHALACALSKRGHAVDLVASPFVHGEPPEPNGYRRHEIFFAASGRILRRRPRSRLRVVAKALDYGPSAARLVRRIDRIDPEVVHVQWLVRPRYDRPWLERVRRGRKAVFTAHDVPALSPEFVRTRVTLFDRVVVHSHRAVDDLAGLGVDRGRLVRIPHPVFEPPAGHAIGSPTGTTLVVFGLIRPYKGIDVLVRALALVAERVPAVRLVVAGDAVTPVEPLQRVAGEVGAAERIEWRLG